MQEIYKTIGRVAESDATVLVHGESGTGKELVARAIHFHSKRSGRSFMAVNSAAIPSELLESELFGHERGAFTGAVAAKPGLLEVAADGTAYLDEVSSLSPAAQAKFLRVLQEKTFRRLGGVTTHPFRARLIVSSRRDLSALVGQGLFRDDFFYRIDVVSVRLPRLAERREDILLLARAFLRRAARAYGRPARRFSKSAEEALLRHAWPGNVRELLHVVERAVLVAPEPEISERELPMGGFSSPEALLETAIEKRWTLKQLTDAYVEETLRRAGGNRTLAARRLGVSRKSLWERGKRRKAAE
jgi:DNA-binding NtrC family response regulator